MSELEQDDKTKNDASPAGATERARALGGAAREWVEANGSLDHMAARYERLYDAVAG